MKLLVYKDLSGEMLKKAELLDPHFLENSDYPSPVARLVPDEEGLRIAFLIAESM